MNQKLLDEIKKLKKTSDLMVSAHAYMKEHYSFWANTASIFLFSCTLLLSVIAFADPAILKKHFGENYAFYIGLFGLGTFVFSYAMEKFEWNTKAIEHKHAFGKFFEIKKKCEEILAKIENNEQVDVSVLFVEYKFICASSIVIPENFFHICKRHHHSKVLISQYLDKHPNLSFLILKVKFWLKDNHKILNDST